MTRRGRMAAAACAVAVVAVSTTACESAEQRRAEHDMAQAADVSTCRADASAAPTPYGDGFPEGWPFPARTTVYHAEDRGGDGTIVTATSAAKFTSVLAFMNHQVKHAGFSVVKGETEEHDAEAEWKGNGFHGRWAIKESAECPGETLIQVLSAKG